MRLGFHDNLTEYITAVSSDFFWKFFFESFMLFFSRIDRLPGQRAWQKQNFNLHFSPHGQKYRVQK